MHRNITFKVKFRQNPAIYTNLGSFKCYVTQMGVGGWCQIVRKKALRRCKVQCYLRYEGVGGGPIYRKKALRNT